jgi:hypothetical protein
VLDLLRDEYKVKSLQTFMCGGIAVKLETPELLWPVLDRLRDEYKIKSLQTFMCNGVAAKLETPELLWPVLDLLRDEYKVKSLQTFMCGGIAAKLETPELLWPVLDRLRDEYNVKSLQTFMCGGIAANLKTPEVIWSMLDRLRDEYNVKDLEGFMCGSVASNANSDEWWSALKTLHDETNGRGLVLVSGSNPIASRLALPDFVTRVIRIGRHLTPHVTDVWKKLKTIMPKNAALLDKLDRFEAYVLNITDGRELLQKLKQFHDTPPNRHVMRAAVEAL